MMKKSSTPNQCLITMRVYNRAATVRVAMVTKIELMMTRAGPRVTGSW